MTAVGLTLFSDASLCPRTGAAGWGAWAKRDGWPTGRVMGGPLRREISAANTAELCGIASALHELAAAQALEGVQSIVVQCDSTIALGAMAAHVANARPAGQKDIQDVSVWPRVRWRRCTPLDREAIGAIRELTFGKAVWLRHIRGHQGTGQSRSWVNEQCDAEAKRHMAALRAEIQNRYEALA